VRKDDCSFNTTRGSRERVTDRNRHADVPGTEAERWARGCCWQRCGVSAALGAVDAVATKAGFSFRPRLWLRAQLQALIISSRFDELMSLYY
jgi:hypothetical protein